MKKLISILTAIMLVMSTSVYAFDQVTIIADDIFEYSGDNASAGENITVTVLNPDMTLNGLEKKEKPMEEIAAFRQTMTDQDGRYSIILNLNGMSNVYEVYTSVSGTEPLNSKLKYVNKSKNKSALSALKTAVSLSDADAVTEVFKNSSLDLGVDTSMVKLLDEKDYDIIGTIIENSLNESDITTPEDTIFIAGKACAIALINSGKLSICANIVDTLIESKTLLGWYGKSFVTNETYEHISDALSKTSSTFSEFDKAIIKATALGIIYSSDGTGYVKDYLIENAKSLEIDADKVTDAFVESIIGKKFYDIEDLEIDNFEEDDELSSSVRPGSGGSGFGRDSSGNAYSGTTVSSGEQLAPVPITENKEDTEFFTDIAGYEWAEQAILGLQKKEIITGRGINEFVPQGTVLREEFVKMLWLAGSFQNIYGDVIFDDVSPENWAYPYIKNAYLCRIVNGVSETSFGYGTNITRQDMAVMCYRMLLAKGLIEEDTAVNETVFIDKDSISAYAVEAVAHLSDLGIILGDENNAFNPENSANRAEAAQIIYKICMHIDENIQGKDL